MTAESVRQWTEVLFNAAVKTLFVAWVALVIFYAVVHTWTRFKDGRNGE